MRLAGRDILDAFKRKHAEIRGPLDAWIAEIIDADWQNPQDIKSRYGTASFLTENRVVFNIKGNKYRLLVKVAYRTGIVSVQLTGTHRQYTSWKL